MMKRIAAVVLVLCTLLSCTPALADWWGWCPSNNYSVAWYYPEYMPVVYDCITPDTCPRQSIMWVQQCLRRLGYGELAVDGNWGRQTACAVAEFKRDYGYTCVPYNVVTYEMVCHMLTLYIQRGQPLDYLSCYCP